MEKAIVTKDFLDTYPEIKEFGLTVGDEFEYGEVNSFGDPIPNDPRHPKPPKEKN